MSPDGASTIDSQTGPHASGRPPATTGAGSTRGVSAETRVAVQTQAATVAAGPAVCGTNALGALVDLEAAVGQQREDLARNRGDEVGESQCAWNAASSSYCS